MKQSKPIVVQFGAGAIGRGFLGQLWTESGCGVLFVDVDPQLVNALHTRGSYPLRLTGDTAPCRCIAPVDACLASDADAVTSGLNDCLFACTAVGVGVFAALAPVIARGIVRRATNSGDLVPLNIICCENQKNAGRMLRAETEKYLPDDDRVRAYFDSHVGFVDASVGRMVPPPTPELLREDPLLVLAEPYAELPVDATTWKGSVPRIAGLLPKPNFDGYVARKLFTHNGGHALLAYEGFLHGHEFIYQCVQDAALVSHLRGFWEETGTALCAAFGFDPSEQAAHQEDLLARFANRELGDTVLRVGRDPVRKLRRDDRLTGAARLCEAHGIAPAYVARAMAAALRFDPPSEANDPSADQVKNAVRAGGVQQAMTTFAGIAPDAPLAGRVKDFFDTYQATSSPQTPANDGG